MTPTLYFLRSSENKIVTDMLQYAHPNINNSEIYSKFYGLTTKDLGLYALVDNTIAGAIWSRKFTSEHKATAFLNEETPVLSMAVLPKFRGKGIGTSMMQQFLVEASAEYENVSVAVHQDAQSIHFYEKFAFIKTNASQTIMQKKLEKKEIVRPSDGYDAQKWMD